MRIKLLQAMLVCSLALCESVHGATPVTALGFTQEEINVWNDRRINGPYKSTGDVSTNSPGDWDRIDSSASSFISNPGGGRWAGQTTDTCATNSISAPGRSVGEGLRNAAFRSLLTGSISDRDAVTTELLAQAATAGTDFSNTTRWCVGSISADGLLDINMWLSKLAIGYDFIRHSISAGNQSTLDTWFTNAGLFIEGDLAGIGANRFPNRKSDNYTSPGSQGGERGKIYFGADGFDEFHAVWDNQHASSARTMGLIGLITGNATLKTEAKRWFKEYIRFGVWYTNTHSIVTSGEYYRWGWPSFVFPPVGWNYASGAIGSAATLASFFARAGDNELFNYSSSDGIYGSEGGPKTLHATITTHFQMMDHQIIRYGSSTSTSDPDLIIDNIDSPSGWHHVGDAWIGPVVNKFYKDDYFKSIYMRQAAGTSAYPSSPATGGFDAWGGEQGIFPGVLFMFGQLENVNDGGGGGTLQIQIKRKLQ